MNWNHGIVFGFRPVIGIISIIVILLVISCQLAFSTPYLTPEEILLQQASDVMVTSSAHQFQIPQIDPPTISVSNPLNRYLLTANWLRSLQVRIPGIEFGGQREGETGSLYDIIQTDNTQEAIVVWSYARGLCGIDTLFQNELANAWIYLRNFPAWTEEGGNNQYYRSHNSGWGIAATMAYVSVTHDTSVIGYGDSCANYVRDYPAPYSSTENRNSEGIATGALARYARWRNSPNADRWLDSALARGQRLRLWIEANPTTALRNSESWALCGGCVFWGVLNSICREDTTFGIPWVNQYGAFMDGRPGTGSWSNAWATWYGHAHTDAFAFTHRQAFRDSSDTIIDYLVNQDRDNDGGIPATPGDPQNQDQSWVSSYLNWMEILPTIGWTVPQYDAEVTSILPTSNYIVTGDSVFLRITVTNSGRRPIAPIIRSTATGTSSPVVRTDTLPELAITGSTMLTFGVGLAQFDSISALAALVSPDSNRANDTIHVQIGVRRMVNFHGAITHVEGTGWNAVVRAQSLEVTTRQAQANTDRSGTFSMQIPEGRWSIQCEASAPAVRVPADIVQVTTTNNSFNRTIPNAQLWVFADDSMYNYSAYILPSLDSCNIAYRLDQASLQTNLYQTITLFPTVLWYTGDRVTPFDTTQLSAIKHALSAGTQVILSGQNIAERLAVLDSNLLHRFGASLQSSHVTPLRLTGLTNTPWAGRNTILITGSTGASNQTSQDALSVYNGGTPWAVYYNLPNAFGVISTSYPDSAKTILMGFGVEALHGTGLTSRNALFQAMFNWLNAISSIDRETPSLPTNLTLSAYPNPFNREVSIRISVPNRENVRLAIYNSLGEMVEHEIVSGVGKRQWHWNAKDASSGIYWIEAQQGQQRTLAKVVLLK